MTKLGFPASYNSLVPDANRLFPRLDFDGNMVDVAVGGDRRPVTSQTVAAMLNKTARRTRSRAAWRCGSTARGTTPRATTRAAGTSSPTPTPATGATGRAARTTRACRATRRSSSGCRPRRRSSGRRTYDEHSTTWGFFVQDDWRVNDKLTLNLGLRYEFEQPLVEKNDQSVSNFDYAYVQPIEARRPGEVRGAQRSR